MTATKLNPALSRARFPRGALTSVGLNHRVAPRPSKPTEVGVPSHSRARGLLKGSRNVAHAAIVAFSMACLCAQPLIASPGIVGLSRDQAALGTAAVAIPQTNVLGGAGVLESLQKKLAEARANLQTAERLADAGLTNVTPGVSLQELATRRILLHRLVRLTEQQLSNLSELETAKTRRADLARQAQAWTRFPESPPYSILLSDRLRESIQVEQLKLKSGEAAAAAVQQLVLENRSALTQAEEKIRQLDERLESSSDAAAIARLSWQRELERLRSQVAAANVGVLESERQLRQEALAESRTRLEWFKRQLIMADADAGFIQADLDNVTSRIQNESHQLEDELGEAESRAAAGLQAFQTARGQLRSSQPNADSKAGNPAKAAEQLAAREAQLETAQVAVRILRLLLEINNVERSIWETRFAAYHNRSVRVLREAERQLAAYSRRAELWKDYQRRLLQASPSQIELQESRVRDLGNDSELLPVAQERLAALYERDQLLLRMVRRIEQVQRVGDRWAEGVRAAEGRLPFFGRVQDLFSDAGSFLEKLWNFELFAAEDTIVVEGEKITGKRSVTLGKVVTALLILAIGIWLTGVVARLAEPMIVRRLKIELNQARLIRRWLRTFMLVCLFMFSLVSVKIPLTVFAFAGGALAIALGFGMQTLLKNFVSGLILLFERPFRVGDVLDVGGQRGTVTEIGLRSSVLQLWDGTETLIPNSSLLENNVSNWTYTSRSVRFSVVVGVAYGSDTRRVTQLLGEIAERHGLVEKEPKPLVLFTEFGESALNFELRFWVDVIRANAGQVASDLRQMIAGAFTENGIVIAFPQRDINLNMPRPLPVEIVTPQQPAAKPDGARAQL